MALSSKGKGKRDVCLLTACLLLRVVQEQLGSLCLGPFDSSLPRAYHSTFSSMAAKSAGTFGYFCKYAFIGVCVCLRARTQLLIHAKEQPSYSDKTQVSKCWCGFKVQEGFAPDRSCSCHICEQQLQG